MARRGRRVMQGREGKGSVESLCWYTLGVCVLVFGCGCEGEGCSVC